MPAATLPRLPGGDLLMPVPAPPCKSAICFQTRDTSAWCSARNLSRSRRIERANEACCCEASSSATAAERVAAAAALSAAWSSCWSRGTSHARERLAGGAALL